MDSDPFTVEPMSGAHVYAVLRLHEETRRAKRPGQ
jgi:hypothetical protein